MLRKLVALALFFCAAADEQPVRNFFHRRLARSGPATRQMTPAGLPRPSSSPAGYHAAKQGATTGLPAGFVKVQDGRFVVGPSCHEFFFAGWNMCVLAR
jgi:hypothetical protein